jgi:hypothetical protein
MALKKLSDIADGDMQLMVALGAGAGLALNNANAHVRAWFKWLTGTAQDGGYVDYCYPNYTNSKNRMLNYAGSTGLAMWSFFLWPQDFTDGTGAWSGQGVGTQAKVDAGALDNAWKALAQQFVDAGLGNTGIRPGWEGDGGQSGAASAIGSANFGKSFARCITQMRTVNGFTPWVEWNFSIENVNHSTLDADLAYPGDQYVDSIGVDIYDQGAYYGWQFNGINYTISSHAEVWAQELLRDLSTQYAFALKHDKPMGITESGPIIKTDGHGGGDTYSFNDMLSWWAVEHPRLKYLAIYNAIDGTADSRLSVNTGPDSAPVYTDATSVYPKAAAGARSTSTSRGAVTGFGLLSRFNGRVGNLEQKYILAMIANYKSLTAGAATVLATLQSTQAALTAANAQVASLTTTNTALNNQHTADTNTINTQAATITTLNAQIVVLQNQGSDPATAGKLAWAEAKVQQLLPYAIGTKKDLAQLTAEEAALQSTIDPIVANLQPLQAADAVLDQAIIDLQNLINSPEP